VVGIILQDNVRRSVVAVGEGRDADGGRGNAESEAVAGALANETALTTARSA
jgi:hypothetical protein